jgi:chaperonin GroES
LHRHPALKRRAIVGRPCGTKTGAELKQFSRRECGSGVNSDKTKQQTKRQTMALNVKPIGDRILVEPVEEKEVKKGGIIIPDTAKEKPQEGIVVALGTGKTNDDGKKIPFEVKKGDRVLVSKYGGSEIKIDGKEYKILSSDDILAILE